MNRRGFRSIKLATTLFIGLTTASISAAESYTFRTIDPPYGEPGIDIEVQIVWINAAGVITVQYQDPPDPDFLTNMHTAVLQRRDWTNIDAPRAETTGGTNANIWGQVVVSYQLENDETWRVAYYRHGRYTPIPQIPGYPAGTTAQGINDFGQIAAVVGDAEGNWHGFFGTARSYDVVDYPDAVYTQANMINNCGVGVGTYQTDDGAYHAFKWEDGEISNIDPPTGSDASAIGINNCDTIVGVYVNADGATVGYIQNGDEFVDFEVPESTYTVPYSINDWGQISGIYGDADGVAHGFVATPRGCRRP